MVGCQRESWWGAYILTCKFVCNNTCTKNYMLKININVFSDSFNVMNFHSHNNYYSHYSIQGKKHPRSYMYNVNTSLDTFSFIAIDASLKPGPKRPFNFIGILNEDEMNRIQQLVNQSKESNAVIVFGHYPTSSIVWHSILNDGAIRPSYISIKSLLGKNITHISLTKVSVCVMILPNYNLLNLLYVKRKSQRKYGVSVWPLSYVWQYDTQHVHVT